MNWCKRCLFTCASYFQVITWTPLKLNHLKHLGVFLFCLMRFSYASAFVTLLIMFQVKLKQKCDDKASLMHATRLSSNWAHQLVPFLLQSTVSGLSRGGRQYGGYLWSGAPAIVEVIMCWHSHWDSQKSINNRMYWDTITLSNSLDVPPCPL